MKWFLIIENQDWIGMSLVDMERQLYQYGRFAITRQEHLTFATRITQESSR